MWLFRRRPVKSIAPALDGIGTPLNDVGKCHRGYNYEWDRPSKSADGDQRASIMADSARVSPDLEAVRDKSLRILPVHLLLVHVYPHLEQTDSSFFMLGSALMQFWTVCTFLHVLGSCGRRMQEIAGAPYMYAMVAAKTFVWGPIAVLVTVATTLAVPLMLETTNSTCMRFTPLQMKMRVLFLASFGCVMLTKSAKALIRLGKTFVVLRATDGIPGYPQVKIVLASMLCLHLCELVASFIIHGQAYLLMWSSDTLLNAVLNGLALLMFFEIDNYLGAALVYMGGAPFARYYQPHACLQQAVIDSVAEDARHLLTDPSHIWINLFARRLLGLYVVFWAWPELVFFPLFFDRYAYSPGQDPLNSCTWTIQWGMNIRGLRAVVLAAISQ